jgi:glucokinase
MTVDRIVFGIDVGGTHVKGLVLAADGRELADESLPTQDRGDLSWRRQVEALFATLQRRFPTVSAVGLGAPGLASRDERSIRSMPGRLQGLENLVWSDVLNVPTVVLNDAHAALLGEAWLGAARGVENALLLTLGTGVGGAALVDGKLLRGHLGRAGHLGHLSLNPDGPADIVGTPGSLEDAIGDCTVAQRTKGRFATTQELVAAATAGDAFAQDVWHRSVRALAAALASLINILDPHTIVIGGGIAAAGEALFGPLRAALDSMEWRIGDFRVALVPAQLGSRAGAFGAAYRALQISSSP